MRHLAIFVKVEGRRRPTARHRSLVVYFGCPVADPRHPEQACRGALAMQRRMRELNRQWRESGLPELRTRIGVNTGTVVAGNLGTDTIFDHTIIGD